MAKLNKWEKQHLRNLLSYEAMIDEVYKTAAREAAALGASLTDFNPQRAFSFRDYPSTQRRLKTLLETFRLSLQAVVVNGVRSEWTLANNKNNELCQQVFGDNIGKLPKAMYDRYMSTNPDALEAFLTRKRDGLRLSDRVWNYTNQFQDEIERYLNVGIRSGLSADEMSRQLRDFLKYPDKLFRRVRDKDGNLVPSKPMSEFHPGQGVYRSSYKNARRLTATETNIAYRTSDFMRWQELDFVVGIYIEPSDTNHEPDICDDLKGKYPKNFKWTGWHPHCRCHAISLLKTQKEMAEDNRRITAGEEPTTESKNTVSDVPKNFTQWIDDNRERAKGWSSMPYFVRDNPLYVKDFKTGVYSAAEKKFTRATHTSEAMKKSLTRYLQQKYPDIPNTEKAAIIEYARSNVSDFRQLNKQLRADSLTEYNAAFSELLSNALSKLPTEEGLVYRTIRLNKTKLAEWQDWAHQKKETVFQGFTSTSSDKNVVSDMIAKKAASRKNNETDVVLVISSKTGHRIEDFASKRQQKELLFDKGLPVKFNGTETIDGQIYFYLTEV